MPELPDITVYLEALEARVLGQKLRKVQIASPFLLRTAAVGLNEIEGHRVIGLSRLGKRICIGMENDVWLVLHLMIAGRLHWKDTVPGKPAAASTKATLKLPKNQLAVFHFENGLLSLTEAGTQRRASLHLLKSKAELEALNRGGVELFAGDEFIDLATFKRVLQSENHTLKRALTDPRLFSGIGNAYSDEILWQAQLSPLALTQKLSPEQIKRLYDATRSQLLHWTDVLRQQSKRSFPEKVTAFREGMATHGRYKEACPRCAAKIQRIRY